MICEPCREPHQADDCKDGPPPVGDDGTPLLYPPGRWCDCQHEPRHTLSYDPGRASWSCTVCGVLTSWAGGAGYRTMLTVTGVRPVNDWPQRCPEWRRRWPDWQHAPSQPVPVMA